MWAGTPPSCHRQNDGVDRDGKFRYYGRMSVAPDLRLEAGTDPAPASLTVDELARRAELPVRTIREYQTMRLLPPPAREGRVGRYGATHLARLAVIRRLQARGYSLAGIRDLLASWRDGDDLGEVLGLAPDELVHVEEPGAPATADQLAHLVPELVPERLDELLATGVVEACGPGRYCVPSPSLLRLTRDALAAGFSADAVLALLSTIGRAAGLVADEALAAMTKRPAGASNDELVAFATRARGLLAHGVGRLTIHTLGARLGITDEPAVPDDLRRFMEDTR
jgi:DNA-binding transcriptional MerR regulator